MTLTEILVSVLPGVALGFLACACRPVTRHVPLPILFSLGYYLGFFLLSVGVDSAKVLGIQVAGPVIVTIFTGVLLASLVAIGMYRRSGRERNLSGEAHKPTQSGRPSVTSLRHSQCAWSLLALVLVTMPSLQLAMAPVSGWDVMGSWSYHARQLIDQGLNGGIIGNYGNLQSHPTASTTLLAWASWASHSAGGFGLWPWLLAVVCVWLVIYGYGLFRQQSLGAAIVATTIVISPLLENHVVLPGYSEIWLTLTSVVASALLAIAIRTQKLGIAFLAVFSALLCIWTRKTGIANTIVLIFAYSLALLYASNWLSNKNLVVFVIVATSLVGFFIVTGFDFSVADIYTHWSPETLTLDFAGRHLELEWQGGNQVVVNEVQSKLTNMSFSTALLAAIFASCVILFKVADDKHGHAVGLFLLCAFLGNLLILVLAQLFSADGMSISLPHMDTGNSRYFLPAVGITGLLVVEAIALFARDALKACETAVG